jgi:carbon-monoxide dehydrogenase large subunit
MVPCAPEIPTVRVAHMVTPALATEYGVKGLGEGGAIAPPAAIANAVADAFRGIGASFNETPLTPRRVSEAIDHARRAGNAARAASIVEAVALPDDLE